ncbi:peptidase [Gammaproteobacteria bacterium SCGC AG-212-F23]|nr:peptidase [Gammaproteobacteria bacterium SCGC AG-212-F23]
MGALWRFFRRLVLCVFFIIFALVVGVLYYMEYELADVEALNTLQLQVPLQVYTRDGKLIAEFGEKRRAPIPFDQIPKPLINAVLATEDQRYFLHPGIDIPGLLRAAVQLIVTGHKTQGGSTITMQVARSVYLTRHKTFGRKLREILYALKIDHQLSKQKILELYLNKIFLGNRAYGVAAAAEVYYGKPLNELTLDQYAMLAGLPQAPSTLNPLANPDAALKRRDHVLTRMYELRYIDEKSYKKAISTPLNASYHAPIVEVKAPYVAELARQQMEQMYGDAVYKEGFKIYTTIDSHLQDVANRAIRDQLMAYDQRHGYRGPAENLGNPDLQKMDKWRETLRNMPVINNLEPAIVVDITDKTITALRSNGDMEIIHWSGLSWARKQIDADSVGPAPEVASDIVSLGDVIRIMQTPTGWRLTQIPKAEAALISLDPNNGAILALVGGFDYQLSNFNRVTDSQVQPGSSFKPFIYSSALDKGYTLSTIINDAPIVLPNPATNGLWRPQNYEHKYYGPTRLHEALIHSRNLVSIRVLSLVGVRYFIQYAQRFGLTAAQLPPVLALALGTSSVTPLQLATGYAVFANTGYKITPYIIDKALDSRGQPVYQAKPIIVCQHVTAAQRQANSCAPRVISAQNAFLMTTLMHDVIEHGTATLARSMKRNDIAGKTGTTQDQESAWFTGFTPDLVTITWVGFDEPQSLHENGAVAALPVWIQFMTEALKNHPDRPMEQPPGIVSMRINPFNGKPTSGGDPDAIFEFYMEPYLPGQDNQNTETNLGDDSTSNVSDAEGIY